MKRLSRQLAQSIIFGLSLAAAGNALAGASLDRIRQTGVVTIGFREGSLPFSYASADKGAPLGYSIDVCHALVESVRRQLGNRTLAVKYVPVASADRVPYVVDGKVDFECGNSTNTKARREKVAFSMPLYFASARLLVRADSGIDALDDLVGKTLAVVKGTTGMLIATASKDRVEGMKLVVTESTEAAVAAVEQRSADAFMTDDILLHAQKAQSKESLAVTGPVMSIEPLAIMFSKSDPELAALVDREMSQLIRNGRLRAMYRKWFQSPLPQRSYNLNVAPNALTADMLVRPSAYVADWVIL